MSKKFSLILHFPKRGFDRVIWIFVLGVSSVLGAATAHSAAIVPLVDLKMTLYENTALMSGQAIKMGVTEAAEIHVVMPETASLDGIYVRPKPGFALSQMALIPRVGEAAFLNRYLGRSVWIRSESKAAANTQGVIRSLSPLVVATEQGLQQVALDQLLLPDLGFGTLPLLDLSVTGSGKFEAEVAYFNPGIRWSADYEMTYQPGEKQVVIQPWAMLVNDSALAVSAQQVSLVAGQISARPPELPYRELGRSAATFAMDQASPQGSKAGLQYRWQVGSLDLKPFDRVRMPLGAAWEMPARIVLGGQTQVRGNQIGTKQPQGLTTMLRVSPIANPKVVNGVPEAGPIAAGNVRVFQLEGSAVRSYLGETQLSQTPPNKDFEVSLGSSFDVRLVREVEHFRVVSDRIQEIGMKLNFSNAGRDKAAVELIENLPGDFSLLERSEEVSEKQNQSLIISFELEPEGSREVQYRVRIRY